MTSKEAESALETAGQSTESSPSASGLSVSGSVEILVSMSLYKYLDSEVAGRWRA